MTKGEALDYWYIALREPLGRRFEIVEGTRDLFKAKLYQARRDANDPSIEGLSLVDSPENPNELWIVKRDGPNNRE